MKTKLITVLIAINLVFTGCYSQPNPFTKETIDRTIMGQVGTCNLTLAGLVTL